MPTTPPPPHTPPPPVRSDDELVHLVEQAVARGIRNAVNDPETLNQFWSGAFVAAQQRATEQTGKLVIGGASALARKLFWFGLFGFGVYQVGGWAGVAKLWHSMFGGSA